MLSFRPYSGDSPVDVQNDNPLPVFQPNAPPPFGYTSKYIATQATFNLKNVGGVLHTVTCNTPVASGVITIYDDISAVTANIIAVITLPGTLLQNGPLTAIYDAKFTRGLTIVTSGANAVWTVTYA
jgi:hypothetical protein